MTKTAAVLLNTDDSKLIMQQRDDKPGIDYPGYLTLFGGLCKPGEEPIKTALREMYEELHPKLDEDELSLWRCYDKPREQDGSPARLHIFQYKIPIQVSKLTVLEGRGYQLIGLADDLNEVKVTDLARAFIPEYLQELEKVKQNY